MNNKGQVMLFKLVLWFVGFISLLLILPIFWQTVSASPLTGVEGWIIKIVPWVYLLFSVGTLLRSLRSTPA